MGDRAGRGTVRLLELGYDAQHVKTVARSYFVRLASAAAHHVVAELRRKIVRRCQDRVDFRERDRARG